MFLLNRSNINKANNLICLSYNYSVQDSHVSHIIEVIEGVPITPPQWARILRKLIKSAARRIDIENVVNQTLGEKMMSTLDHWISLSGKEARFNLLVDIIEQNNKSAAGILHIFYNTNSLSMPNNRKFKIGIYLFSFFPFYRRTG